MKDDKIKLKVIENPASPEEVQEFIAALKWLEEPWDEEEGIDNNAL